MFIWTKVTGNQQCVACVMVDVVDLAVPQDKLCCYLFVDEGSRVERTQLSSHVVRTPKFDSWDFSPSVLDPAHTFSWTVSCDQWLSLSVLYHLLLLSLLSFLPPFPLFIEYQISVQISVLKHKNINKVYKETKLCFCKLYM